MRCFRCIPPPASLQPRKIYNVLVPDVFPKVPPPINEPVPNSIKRKIGKLHEYVQQSPGQIAKVSRRLNRRIKQALYDKHLGYVKIAVATYAYLLKQSTAEKSRYTPSYFSKELIDQPDAVIDTLINYPIPEVQAMGAELLAAYIEAQTEVENQPLVVEQLTKSVVRLMTGKSKEQGGAAGAAAAAGSAQAPKLPEETKAACMKSVCEYIKFCQRVKKIPKLLAEVQECILMNVDLSSKEVQQLLFTKKTVDAAAVSPGGSAAAPAAAPAAAGASASKQTSAELALSAMGHLRPYMQDVAIVHRLLDTQLGYLDRGSKWEQPTLVDGMLGLIQHACGEQTYPLYTSLLRHSSTPGLPPKQREIIIHQALLRGSLYSLSAMSLALAELPKTLAVASQETGSSGAAELQALKKGTQEAVQKLALQVGDVAQVCEALGGALRQHSAEQQSSPALTAPRPQLLAALELGVAAIQAVLQAKGPGCSFPPKVSPTSLLTQLCGVLWEATPRCAWSEQSQALDARSLAVQALQEVMAAPGFGVREERPALVLLAGAAALATAPGVRPRELAAASRLTSAAASSGCVEALVQLSALVLALRTLLLKEAAAASPAQTCSGLLLVECLLQQLSAAARCPPLQQLLTAGDGAQQLQQGAGGLKLAMQGQALPVLQPLEQQAKQGAEQEKASKDCVQAAAAAAGGQAKWVESFVAALGSAGLLAVGEQQQGVAGARARQLCTADAAGVATSDQVRALFAPLLLSQLPLPVAAVPAVGRGLEAGSSVLVDQARLLSQRVEQTWSAQQHKGEAGQGHGAEQLNLERVLQMLEADQQPAGVQGGATTAASRPAAAPAAGAVSPRGALSISEVLDLVAAPADGKLAAQDCRAGSRRVDMRSLARQLEPLSI